MGYVVRYTWKDYWPLAALFGVAALAGLAASQGMGFDPFMTGWMGMIFLLFAVFKLINLKGFAEGLRKYDVLAQKIGPYAFVAPFIELTFALLFLAHSHSPVLYAAVFLYAGYNAVAIRLALRKGLDTRCACLGTALDLPLSTVSFWENIVMCIMVALMVIGH